MTKYKGGIELSGVTYNVEVINGERFIEGKTVDEFIDWLLDNGKVQDVKTMASLGHDILRLNK